MIRNIGKSQPHEFLIAKTTLGIVSRVIVFEKRLLFVVGNGRKIYLTYNWILKPVGVNHDTKIKMLSSIASNTHKTTTFFQIIIHFNQN